MSGKSATVVALFHSRNNRRKTQGKFTTTPTQYMQFKNLVKYMHVIEGENIIIINGITQDRKAVFDYEEVCRYLEINNIDVGTFNMYWKELVNLFIRKIFTS